MAPFPEPFDHRGMGTSLRRASFGSAVAIVGTAYSLVFGGSTIPQCLGPLGVTLVRCVAHGGRPPTDPPWPPMVLAYCALGAVIGLTVRRSWIDGLTGLAGLIAGPLAYSLMRIRSLEGPDYDGKWLVVPIVMDHWAIGLWAIAGCLLALATTGLGRCGVDAFLRRSRERTGVTPGLSPS